MLLGNDAGVKKNKQKQTNKKAEKSSDKSVGRRLTELGLEVVPVGRGLLQGGVRDLHLFAGICGRLEKVGHEEDLQDTEEEEDEEESSSHALFTRSYLSNHGDSDDFLLHFVVSNIRQTVPLFCQTPRSRSSGKTYNLITRVTRDIFISFSVSSQQGGGSFKLLLVCIPEIFSSTSSTSSQEDT